jgi:hypothetical protein
MCESVTCNACCSVKTAMDNLWLLLGFLWCLLHFVRHMCLMCFCIPGGVGEVYTQYTGLTVGMLPCLQIWLCGILGALSLVLSFQNEEVNIICYSEPVKCCRSQTNIVNICVLFKTGL